MKLTKVSSNRLKIQKFPIETSVVVSNLVSRRIQEGLTLETEVAVKNIKPTPSNGQKGIFIA